MKLLEIINPSDLKLQIGQVKRAIESIAFCLFTQFGEKYSINDLVRSCNKPNQSLIFSKNLNNFIKNQDYSKTTSRSLLTSIKKVLQLTTVDSLFVSQISLGNVVTKNNSSDRCDTEQCLPLIYKNRDSEDNARVLLLSWINKLKNTTRNKASSNVKSIVLFWIKLLSFLNMDIDAFEMREFNPKEITHAIENCPTKIQKSRKNLWAKLLFVNILELNIENEVFKTSDRDVETEETVNDGKDMHKFSPQELDRIYEVSCETTREELIFSLLITTGMRIGGLVNIKVSDICDIICNDYVIKNTGRTIEKFNKWFSFVLTDRVKYLLHDWLKSYRPATDSPYLFPGKGKRQSMTTHHVRDIFKAICTRAGVTGPHVHPHSLRHSFARMLIDSGNNIENVSKIMGHSDSKTTSMFYLKQSSSEAAMNSNIPWLKTSQKKAETVPTFLQDSTGKKKKIKKEKKIKFATELKNLHQQKISDSSMSLKSPTL
jgi:integrase/recombinase XerD